jgi:hypothetical protein
MLLIWRTAWGCASSVSADGNAAGRLLQRGTDGAVLMSGSGKPRSISRNRGTEIQVNRMRNSQSRNFVHVCNGQQLQQFLSAQQTSCNQLMIECEIFMACGHVLRDCKGISHAMPDSQR